MVNEIKPINLSQKALSVSSSTNVKNSFFLYPTIPRRVLTRTKQVCRQLLVDRLDHSYLVFAMEQQGLT